jgi:hypothetical protein
MRQVRSHLSFANVASAVALFLALSTGSAFALSGANTVFTDDITDNEVRTADVRNDSLSGGGLAAADLKSGSVGTAEVAANSLNGGDINESGLGIIPNANQLDGVDSTGFLASGNVQKLIYETPAGASSPTALATVGPVTIKGDCVDNGFGATSLKLIANVAGTSGTPAGSSDYMHHEHTNLSGGGYTHRSGQVSITANTDTEIIAPTLTAGTEVKRTAGTAMLRAGSDVVQVDFNGVAEGLSQATAACHLYGTATMGT